MIQTNVNENNVQQKVAKKKVVLKTKIKPVQNTAKIPVQVIWYASILF